MHILSIFLEVFLLLATVFETYVPSTSRPLKCDLVAIGADLDQRYTKDQVRAGCQRRKSRILVEQTKSVAIPEGSRFTLLD